MTLNLHPPTKKLEVTGKGPVLVFHNVTCPIFQAEMVVPHEACSMNMSFSSSHSIAERLEWMQTHPPATSHPNLESSYSQRAQPGNAILLQEE